MWLQQLPNGTSLHDVILWIDGNGIPDRDSGTAYTETAITRGVEIHGGTALEFDGADSAIDIGSDPVGTKAITYCAWLHPQTRGELDNSWIINNGKFRIVMTAAVGGRIALRSDGATQIAIPDDMGLNTWSFACATRQTDGTGEIFIDGVSVVTGDTGTPASGTENLFIGNDNAASRTFDGFQTSIIIFNKILTAKQIGQMYNKTK